MASGLLAGIQLPGSQRPLALIPGSVAPQKQDPPVIGTAPDTGADDPDLDTGFDDDDDEGNWEVIGDDAASTPGSGNGSAPGNGSGASGPGYAISISAPEAVMTGKGRVYFVDYDKGKDTNSGTTASSPWKHAPGDTAAAGKAASVKLAAGDTVRFRGGVHYRGSFKLAASGTAAAPIIYTGSGYGTGRAIWDGSDPVTSAAKCPSQSACGGASNWRNLWLIRYTEPASDQISLFDGAGPLHEAMAPANPEPFWQTDVSRYVTIPRAQAKQVASGRLENATLAAAARNEPNARIAIWVSGNRVTTRDILSVSGNVIRFEANDVVPYTDRDGRAAIVGAVKSVSAPGLFARLGHGQAIVYPRSGGENRYFIGTGRAAFNLNGQNNVTIHGLRFAHGTSSPGSTREGVVLANYGQKSTNIRFEGNEIHDFAMQSGYGVIQLNQVDQISIRANSVENIRGGSGMRFGGVVTNLLIEGNKLHWIGRTGIYLPSVQDAVVRGNILSEIKDVHGNAMSYYMGHRNVMVMGNCVFSASRPLTYHGNGANSPLANLQIRNNILIATPDASAALYSWGSNTRTVLVDGNVTLGKKLGLKLHAADQNVTVTGNRTSGIVVVNSGGVTPPGWVIRDNSSSLHQDDVRSMTLSRKSCQADGLNGPIRISHQY